MTTQLDFSVGIGKEGSYGTAVTPTRFFESEATFKHNISRVQSKGLRPTKGVNRLNRSVLSKVDASGDVTTDASTKGLGFLLEAVLGVVVNTTLTDPVGHFQQNHTLAKTDPVGSYTIQEIIPTLGGGAGNPHTFVGCVADTLDISVKEGGLLEIKVGFVAKDLETSASATAASYPAGDSLYGYVHGSIRIGGELSAPTTTALAELDSAAAVNIKDFSVSLKRNLDGGGWNLGGAGRRTRKPALGVREISGKMTAEYTDNSLRDAYLEQTPLPLIVDLVADGGDSALQVVLPAVLLKGEVPTTSGGDPATQSIDFDAYDDGEAAEPIWVVYRTTDTTP